MRIFGYLVDVGVVEVREMKDGKQQQTQYEVDLIATNGQEKYYIQSALHTDTPEKMSTELRPLKYTRDFFKKIIVTKTAMKPWTDEDGIVHVGLYEFLLNPNSLEL